MTSGHPESSRRRGRAPASGELGERLVGATVQAAARIVLDRVPANHVLAQRTAWLVAEAMVALGQHRWRVTLVAALLPWLSA